MNVLNVHIRRVVRVNTPVMKRGGLRVYPARSPQNRQTLDRGSLDVQHKRPERSYTERHPLSRAIMGCTDLRDA